MEMAKVSFTAEEAYVDKLAIAQAFGKAAKSYDQHAAFQREVGHKLLDKLPKIYRACVFWILVVARGISRGNFCNEALKSYVPTYRMRCLSRQRRVVSKSRCRIALPMRSLCHSNVMSLTLSSVA